MDDVWQPQVPPQARTPWSQVLLIVGAGVIASFQIGKAPPVLPLIRLELGMSLFLSSWILSIFNIIGLVLGSAAGALADALGHRRLVLCGLAAQAVGSLLGSLSPDPILLLATRVVEGLGFLTIAVSAPALIFRVTRPEHVRIALSIWSCFVPAGTATILFLAPLLVGAVGWRGFWQVNAALLGLYTVVLARRMLGPGTGGKSGNAEPRHLLKDVWQTATSSGPLLLAIIFGTYSVQWLAVMGFLPTLLMESRDLGAGAASVLTAIMVAMNVPGNLAGGWLLHRGTPGWSLIAGASLTMGICSVAIFTPGFPFWAQCLGCLLFSSAGGLLPASVIGEAPRYAPTSRLVATTNGLITQGSQLGQVIGPPLVAFAVSAGGGWHSAPWVLGGAAFLGAALSLPVAALERRRVG
jgi:MFS family permease